jgi:hypothetical protein
MDLLSPLRSLLLEHQARGGEVAFPDLILVGLAAGLGLALVELTIRRTDVGAALVLFLFVLEEALPHVALAVFVGPFRISTNDLLFLVLLAAAVARLLRLRRLTPSQRLLVTFFLLLAWSLFRGIELYALTSSVNEARRFLRFSAAALYFSTVEPKSAVLSRLGALWLAAALALGAITLLRWIGHAVGLYGGFFGNADDLRVVPATAALVIGMGVLIALPLLRSRTLGPPRFIAPVLFVFVVLLQHRSVWIVTGAGILYLVLRDRDLSRQLASTLLGGIVVLSFLLFAVFEDREDEVSQQLATSAQNTDTFEWRVNGWIALFRDSAPEEPAEWLLGKPFGSGWQRISEATGQEIEVSPHNFYIEVLLRMGVVGLVVVLSAYYLAVRDTRIRWKVKSTDGAYLTISELHVAASVLLLYFVVYSAEPAHGMLLGLACAYGFQARADDSVVHLELRV